MVKSLVVAGCVNAVASQTDTTNYWNIYGYIDRGTEVSRERRIYKDGVLSNFQVSITLNSCNADTVFTLRKNGSDGNSTVTVPAGTTGVFKDTTHTDSITSGDLISFKSVPGAGSTGLFNITYGCALFTPTDTSVCSSNLSYGHIAGRSGLTGASTRYYQALNGFFDTALTTEATANYKMQISGTFKNMTGYVESNSRTTTTALEFRKGGTSQSLVCSYGSTVTGEQVDTTHTVSVVDNDLVNFSILNGTGTSAIVWNRLTAEFETTASSNLAQSLYIGYNQTIGTQARNTTRYYAFCGYFDALTAEANTKFKMPVGGFTAKNLSVNVTTNSISSASTFVLRVNGANSALTIPITASTTGWFEDTTHSVTINEGDDLDFALVSGTGSGSQTMTIKTYAVHLEASGVRNLTATISDSMTISHTTNDLRGLLQTRSDSLTLSESIPRLRLLLQTNSDSLTLTGGSPVNLRGLNQTSSDSLTLSDGAPVNLRGLIQTISDSVGIAEAVLKAIPARIRLLSESVALSHDTNKYSGKNRSVTGDTLSFVDDITEVRNKVRAFTETLSISEDISRIKTVIRTISESLGVTESMDRLRGKARTLSSSVGFSHDLSRLTTRLRMISENISLVDDAVRTRFRPVSIDDEITFEDSSETVRNKIRSISESITLSEAVLGLRGFIKTISDSLGDFTDSIERLRGKKGTTSDSLTFDSLLEQVRGKLRLQEHMLEVQEDITRETTRLREFAENLNLSEVIETGGANLVKTINETLDLSSTAIRSTTRLREISDSLGLLDGAERIRSNIKSISDSLDFEELVEQIKLKLAYFEDTLTFSDTNNRLIDRIRTISNSLSLSASTTNVKSRIRTIQQSLSLSDSSIQDALSSIIKTISEEISFSDGANRTLGVMKTISQSLNLTSSVTKAKLHRIKLISQSLNLSDSTSRLRTLVLRGFNQNLTLSSTAIKSIKSAIKQFIIKIKRLKKFRI